MPQITDSTLYPYTIVVDNMVSMVTRTSYRVLSHETCVLSVLIYMHVSCKMHGFWTLSLHVACMRLTCIFFIIYVIKCTDTKCWHACNLHGVC